MKHMQKRGGEILGSLQEVRDLGDSRQHASQHENTRI